MTALTIDRGHGEPDEASSHRRYDDLVVLVFVLGDLGDFFFAEPLGDQRRQRVTP
jgi:hypothetical protein